MPPPAAEDAPLVAGDATAPAAASNGARQSQWYQTTSILLAEIMGTGVLGLPAAMANLGWVLGVLSSVSFAAASTYAALLLSRVRNELYNSAESYADLALHTGGEGFAAFTRCTVLLTWSTLLPYYLLASAESMQGLFAGTGLALWQWTLVVAALLFLPLQARSLHQLTSLALASTVAIVIADAIILTVLVGEARGAAGATRSGRAGGHERDPGLWPPLLHLCLPGPLGHPRGRDGGAARLPARRRRRQHHHGGRL